MGKKKEKLLQPQKRIADDILLQIGKSVLLVFVIVAIVAIFMVRAAITSSKQSELTLESESAAHQLASFFKQYSKAVSQLAANPEIQHVLAGTKPGMNILESDKMDTVHEHLDNVTKIDSENIMSAWIADLDTSVLTQSDGFTSDSDWDIKSRPWYTCIDTKKIVLTEPYTDSSTGKMILSAVAPVMDKSTGEVLGATGLDISMDHVTAVMGDYKIGRNGYILLLSANGSIIYHPQSDLVDKNITEVNVSQNLIDATQAGTEQFLRYKVGGTSKYGVSEPVSDTGYIVVSNLPVFEYYSMLIWMIAALVVVFVAGILLIVFRIKKSAAKLTKPILELNHTALQLAAGDLDVRLDVKSENEIGELGDSIGETVRRLKEYIVYIDETADVLAHMADGKLEIDLQNDYVGEFQKIKTALLNISSSMNEVMQGINESASQVSTGASDLADASQVLAESASTQAASVEELVATSTSIMEQVEATRKDAELSAEATKHVTSMMDQNQREMKQMMDAVNKIHETSQKVVGIIQTIEEIAEQTNLLSLNASIEAARAGEVGRGFVVVASEIGKLALESSQAANMTRELIEVSMEEINRGKEIADGVMNSLEESVNAVDDVDDMIKKTADNASMQAESMEQVRIGIEEIAQGIQDNSAAAEETSATSEQLASQASILNDMVHRFELYSN